MTANPPPRFLSESDVRELLDLPTAITLMRDAFVELSSGGADAPVRTSIDLAGMNARALFMPAHSPRRGAVGVKSVMVHRDNPAAGLPRIHAMMLVFDDRTGAPVAVIDAEYLTAARTGAASAVATEALARPDSVSVALFGAGVQGETQLDAVCAVRPIRRALVFDPTPGKAAEFGRRASERLEIEVYPAAAPDELSGADIVCTATTARTPVFDRSQLGPGVHINGVGSYTPEMAEIPPDVIAGALLVVDQREACLVEAGDIIQPIEAGLLAAGHIHAELGEVLAGTAEGRTSSDQVTVFKSVGNAIQDLAVTAHLLDAASKRGIGTVLR